MVNFRAPLALTLALTLLFEVVSPVHAEGLFQSISDVLPSRWGQVTQVSPLLQPGGRPDFLLIQDVHVNRSVQHSISKLLHFFHAQGWLDEKIGVEGSTGSIDVRAMQNFPDRKARYAASDFLIGQGEMPGAVHFVVTEGWGKLYGLENPQYYDAGLELFRQSFLARTQALEQLRVYEKATQRISAEPRTKALVASMREDLKALRELMEIGVTPDEVAEHAQRASLALARLRDVLPSEIVTQLEMPLSAAVDFYSLALLRDKEIFRRLVRLRTVDHQRTTTLVIGGFHVPGLTQQLQQSGFSYMVVTPHLGAHGLVDKNLYIKRMLGFHVTDDSSAFQAWPPRFMPPLVTRLFFSFVKAKRYAVKNFPLSQVALAIAIGVVYQATASADYYTFKRALRHYTVTFTENPFIDILFTAYLLFVLITPIVMAFFDGIGDPEKKYEPQMSSYITVFIGWPLGLMQWYGLVSRGQAEAFPDLFTFPIGAIFLSYLYGIFSFFVGHIFARIWFLLTGQHYENVLDYRQRMTHEFYNAKAKDEIERENYVNPLSNKWQIWQYYAPLGHHSGSASSLTDETDPYEVPEYDQAKKLGMEIYDELEKRMPSPEALEAFKVLLAALPKETISRRFSITFEGYGTDISPMYYMNYRDFTFPKLDALQKTLTDVRLGIAPTGSAHPAPPEKEPNGFVMYGNLLALAGLSWASVLAFMFPLMPLGAWMVVVLGSAIAGAGAVLLGARISNTLRLRRQVNAVSIDLRERLRNLGNAWQKVSIRDRFSYFDKASWISPTVSQEMVNRRGNLLVRLAA